MPVGFANRISGAQGETAHILLAKGLSALRGALSLPFNKVSFRQIWRDKRASCKFVGKFERVILEPVVYETTKISRLHVAVLIEVGRAESAQAAPSLGRCCNSKSNSGTSVSIF